MQISPFFFYNDKKPFINIFKMMNVYKQLFKLTK